MPAINTNPNLIENDPIYQEARRLNSNERHIRLEGECFYPGPMPTRGETPVWMVIAIVVIVPAIFWALWVGTGRA